MAVESDYSKRQRVLDRLRITGTPIPDDDTLQQMIESEPSQEEEFRPTPTGGISRDEALSKYKQIPTTRGPSDTYVPPTSAKSLSDTVSANKPDTDETDSGFSPDETGATLPAQPQTPSPTSAVTAPPSPRKNAMLADSLRQSDEALKDYTDLLNKYRTVAPPDTLTSLRDAIAQAKEARDTATTRNEWLEVAQMLGKAGAQFAASAHGQATNGRTNMGLDFLPGIDYEKRNDRARQDYETALKEAGVKSELTRQNYLDTQKAKQEEFEAQKGGISARLSAAQHAGLLAVGEDRVNAMEDRYNAARDRGDQKEADRLRGLSIKDLRAQDTEAQNQLKHRNTALSDITTMSNSQYEKNKDRIAKELAAGAIDKDPDVIRKEIEDQRGFFTPKAKEDEGILGVRNKYMSEGSLLYHARDIRSRLDTLSGVQNPAEVGGPSQQPGTTGAPALPPPPPGKVRVRIKQTGQTGTVDDAHFDSTTMEKMP